MVKEIAWVGVSLFVLAGCGASGGDGRGDVVVLEGDEAIQAGVAASISLASAIVAILGDWGDGADARGVAEVDSSTANVSRRAVRVACPQGGSVDGECRERGGRTIVSTSSDRCAVLESGILATATGRLTASYERTGLCGSSTIPDDIPFTFAFEDFREEQRRDGVLVRVFQTTRLNRSFRPGSGGCSVNQGTHLLQGDARVTQESSDFDLLLRMDGLGLDIVSDGNPCEDHVTVSGRLDVDDRVRGSRFAGELRALRLISRRQTDGLTEVALDGTMEIDCLGSVSFVTQTPVALAGICPIEGEVGISLADDSTASTVFSGGVAIDYDGDGAVDFEAAGCGAESLTVCR